MPSFDAKMILGLPDHQQYRPRFGVPRLVTCFTVRSEGENPVTASYEIPIGDAIALLDDALSDYANRE